MVCPRCIETVREIIEYFSVQILKVDLGEVIINRPLSEDELSVFRHNLSTKGFKLLENKNVILIDKIKSIIIDQIHYSDNYTSLNYSTLISSKLNHDYHSLSRIFSSIEGCTIERFIIKQKIEKVKELIQNNELNISEISIQLGYSSAAHLSAQFKKETGMTPSVLKKLNENFRKSIDSV